jgi:hypothetical protein
MSCTGDGNGLYEHDRTGTPFDSILDMRAERIRNIIQQIPKEHVDVAPKILPVSVDIAFETKQHKKTDSTPPLIQTQLLDPIAKVTGVPFDCTPSAIRGIEPAYQPLEEEYVNWINAHVNWATEAMIHQKKQTWEDLKGLHSSSEDSDSKSEDDSEEESGGGEVKKGTSKKDSPEKKKAVQTNATSETTSSDSSDASITKGDSEAGENTENETSTADVSGEDESGSESGNESEAKDKENIETPHESDSDGPTTKEATPKKTGNANGGDKTGTSNADTKKSDSSGTDTSSSTTKETDGAPTTKKNDGQETDSNHTKADGGGKQKSGGSAAKANKGIEMGGKKEKSHHHSNSTAADGSDRDRELLYGADP